MAQNDKVMTEEQFKFVCLKTKPKENMREALYEYLVQGVALSDACAKHGLHKNSLTRKCAQLFELIIPEDWEFKLIALPPDEMRKVEELSENLKPKAQR